MSKKVSGKCCICGQEKKLTFEHIPPRAAFNQFGLKLYDFQEYIIQNKTKYKQFQNGAGKYSLCASCNNLTGGYYGAAYAEFATQGMQYYRKKSHGGIDVPYEIYPLKVLKQVVSCFASTNGYQWCQKNPAIREFLLDPYNKILPSKIDIRMYMQTNNQSKFEGILSQINSVTGECFQGSEFAYSPFSFICICNKEDTNYKKLNELYSIRYFSKYGYDDRIKLYIKLPKKPCNPVTLDFREGIPDICSL